MCNRQLNIDLSENQKYRQYIDRAILKFILLIYYLYETAFEIGLLQIEFFVLLDTDRQTPSKFSFRFLTMTRFVRVTRVYAGLFFENSFWYDENYN